MYSDVLRNIAHVFVTSGRDQDRPSKRDCFIATFMQDGIKQEGQEPLKSKIRNISMVHDA